MYLMSKAMKPLVDVMPPSQRHKAMAHNRGRTRPERAFATALWHQGLRYLTGAGYRSRYGNRLAGNPDLVFARIRVALFVDGCFWHGCTECDTGITRSSEAWQRKIAANRARDRQNTTLLEAQGWTVLRVPEHALRTKKDFARTVDFMADTLMALGQE